MLHTNNVPKLSLLQRFLMDYIRELKIEKPAILDYGCGSGEMVVYGLSRKLNIKATDVFYKGSTSKDAVVKAKLLNKHIFEMKNNRIPFPDNSFDLVLSNQVFEHIDDLDTSLKEIARVLKKGGNMLSAFPTKEVFFEDHSGIPALHKFGKDSKFRYHYAYFFRRLGFGFFKRNKPLQVWVNDAIDWLDKYTFYKSKREILRTFSKYFSKNMMIKSKFIKFIVTRRLPPMEKLIDIQPIKSLADNFEGLVVLSTK